MQLESQYNMKKIAINQGQMSYLFDIETIYFVNSYPLNT